jgi:hypothetical protein
MKNEPAILVFQNPRKNGKINAALRLNEIASLFEKTDFYKQFVSKAGFELNPISFEWEYIIEFKKKTGFVVLMEDNHNLDLVKAFIYPKGNEILTKPNKFINCSNILDDSLNSHYTKLWENEMSSIYQVSILNTNRRKS